MNSEILRFRTAVIDETRLFFKEQGYLEVDTPLMALSLIPESSIEIFQTYYRDEKGEEALLSLVPSPEVWMKQLLAEGAGNMFQICRCFRNGEPAAGIHNPEFTMLEYYTVGANYLSSIALTEELFSCFGGLDRHGCTAPPFMRISMEEAFFEYAGVDLVKNLEADRLLEECVRLTGTGSVEDSWEQLYNRLFITLVEPGLPKNKPVVLYDYPSKVSTLAKSKTGTPWAERWELYIRGIELANCFTEETDKTKVGEFFETEVKERERRGMPLASNMTYPDIFTPDFPPCSGVALGMDRLIMLLSGGQTIREIIPFPFLNTGQQPS